MTSSIIMSIKSDVFGFGESRNQPFIVWLQLLNFVMLSVVCWICLKIYRHFLSLFEWIFPFKCNKFYNPIILVIGNENDLNDEIVQQLSQLFHSKIIRLKDVDENDISPVEQEEAKKQSRIIYIQKSSSNQEAIMKLSVHIRRTFGEIDLLLISQKEEFLVDSEETHSFLKNLNKQLLTQFWMVMAFLPGMLHRNNGHIVSLALDKTSNLTNTGNPSKITMNQSGAYSFSKKSQSKNDNQYYLLSEYERSSKNGSAVTPKSIIIAGHEISNNTERQPLTERTTEPVRLTPAWEDNNLTEDELNFKNLSMEQANLELNPPKDRLMIVYLILMLHGIGILMPWNMFITAKSYFVDYKLSEQYTGTKSDYVTSFQSYIAFASQIPNLAFNWINIFIQLGGNLTTRIVWSIFVEVVIFVFTVILAMTDSSEWPGAFFWLTMVTVVVLNVANGIYQNTVYGMGAKLPFKYTGAIILGSNVSGTFTAIINLLSIAIAPNKRTAAIYYFITALFVLLACFDTYFALPLNRFYRYHEYIKQKSNQIIRRENIGVKTKVPYWLVFKKAFPQLFNVFFVFFVTLAIFPSMHSDIQKSNPDFFIPDKYYVSIMCFVTFNVTAMLGSLVTNWIRWPSAKYLVIPVVLRVLFIPFFLFCNYKPYGVIRVLPILFANDWGYWIAAILMGFTSGYCSSLAMMYTSRTVEPVHAAIAGMFGGAILITGVCAGVLFACIFPWIVRTINI